MSSVNFIVLPILYKFHLGCAIDNGHYIVLNENSYIAVIVIYWKTTHTTWGLIPLLYPLARKGNYRGYPNNCVEFNFWTKF